MTDVAGGLKGLGVITDEELAAANALAPGVATTLPGRLAAVGVDADEIARALSTLSGLAVLPPGMETALAPAPLPGVDHGALHRLVAAPLGMKDGVLLVAVADPGAAQQLARLGLPAHRVYLATEAAVLRALDRVAPFPPAAAAPFPSSGPSSGYMGTERDLAFEDDGRSIPLAGPRPGYQGTERDVALEDDGRSIALAENARPRPRAPAPAPELEPPPPLELEPPRAPAPAPFPAPFPASAPAWEPEPEPAFVPPDAGPAIAPLSFKAAQAKIAAQGDAAEIPFVASPFDAPPARSPTPAPAGRGQSQPGARAPSQPNVRSPSPPAGHDAASMFASSNPAPPTPSFSDVADEERPAPPQNRVRAVTGSVAAPPPEKSGGGKKGLVVGAIVAGLAVVGGGAALALMGKEAPPPPPVVAPVAPPQVVDPLEARQKEALADARKKLAAKDLAGAVDAFSAAVDVDPASPLAYEALVGRGDARAANLDTAGAQSDYKRALNGLSMTHPMRAQAEAALAKLPSMSP